MRNYSIGFVSPTNAWGGLEMNVFRLAVWLKQRGWDIILYGIPDSPLYDNIQKNAIRVRALASTSKVTDIMLTLKLVKLVKKDNVKILILHTNKNFLLAVLAKILSRNFFKLIYDQHMQLGAIKKDFFHTWQYRHIDSWAATLPMMKRNVVEKTNIAPDKVRIIHHGIELERFVAHKPHKYVARDRLKIPREVLLAGVVGRLDPKKCQHVLIEACAKVHQAGRPLHLLIVGDRSLNEETYYTERVHGLTKQLNLEEFVHFRPHLTEVEYAYACLDLFTLTSKSESYGMVTIEAMASELPVIGTNSGGTRDIIADNVNGILVEPLDADELYKAMLRILTDKETSKRLAARAKEDAIDKYSHSRQCELLESLFDSLRSGR